ncbi:hypothetical protein [Kocuria sabuli]|uniref:hypothetical protein n=1 Tax=Kocuria sabuli TaxID=3071448 RepID=UPI0034D77397
MVDKISVTVQVDLDGKYGRIVATGCLTGAGQRALHPLIRRARALTPGTHVVVDIRGAHLMEPAGVDLLRRAVAQDGAVELALPDPLSAHLPTPVDRTPVVADGPAAPGRRARTAA